MHEFVASARPLAKDRGIRAMDIGKRLIDFNFHAPTVYFPLIVPEALMIEPTETESRETLEAFAKVLLAIAAEDPRAPPRRPAHDADQPARRGQGGQDADPGLEARIGHVRRCTTSTRSCRRGRSSWCGRTGREAGRRARTVGAEVVALGLEQVGGEPFAAVAVEVGEGGGHRGDGDAVRRSAAATARRQPSWQRSISPRK